MLKYNYVKEFLCFILTWIHGRGHVDEAWVFNKFFRLSIHASAAKIQPDKVVHGAKMAIFASRICSDPRAAHAF